MYSLPFIILPIPSYAFSQDGTMGEAFVFPSGGAVHSSSTVTPVEDQPVYGPLTQAQSGRRHAVDQGDTYNNRCTHNIGQVG